MCIAEAIEPLFRSYSISNLLVYASEDMKAGIEQAGLVKHRKWKPRNFKKESKRWLKRAKKAKESKGR